MPGADVHVESLAALFRNLRLPVGLVVDEVRLEGDGLALNTPKSSVGLDRPGRVVATISEHRLAEFLNLKAPGGLRGFAVRAEGGELTVTAQAPMLIPVKATAQCSLEIVDGKRLNVVLKDVEVLGLGARGLVEAQLDKLNPVFDAAELPLDVTLTRVEVEGGLLTLHGEISKDVLRASQ